MPFLSFYTGFFCFSWTLVTYICLFGLVEAQVGANGQTFTNGLAILNSPSRNAYVEICPFMAYPPNFIQPIPRWCQTAHLHRGRLSFDIR